jgi:hypothetical protein
MEGRIVTNQQAQELQGVFFDSNTFFDFAQDINNVYFLFLSEQDELDIESTEYAYLLNIPLSAFEPKPKPTPPPFE